MKSALSCITAMLLASLAATTFAQDSARTVEVASKPGRKWSAKPTRILEDLPDAGKIQLDADLNRFGGRTSRKEKATGFFHTAKIDGRWWLVDPEGGLFVHRGIAGVKKLSSTGAKAAWKTKFGTDAEWSAQTTALLRAHGFNGLGAFAETEPFRAAQQPLVYTRIWNFMQSYGKKRGGTSQKSGHMGYPGDCIFVFDPGFETFCEEHAKQLTAEKDDPWLLGHFSDNELPFRAEALKNYLALPATDHGHQAALKWLRDRHGADATTKDIVAADLPVFHEFMVERYFRIVAAAIKRHDPNHLYLGSRFYGSDVRFPEVFRAAGKHVDVVSVNYYNAWTPNPERLNMWTGESGKPILITEWYAKGADSGLGNTSGAGWLVKTQRDRGRFYENFTLGLMQSKVCVGWHWFRYQDNDPTDKKSDPSNRDANKGIVNYLYEPYTPLLDSMKRINERAYSLVEYFDNR